MRIISQDGTIDIPYEQCVIQRFREKIYFLNKNLVGVEQLVNDMEMASYSTEEKAKKAVEMLREQYSRLQVVKILASGTCEHMEKSLSKDEFLECNLKYREMNIFQFPQDEDLEV